jgi:hypothetical protein
VIVSPVQADAVSRRRLLLVGFLDRENQSPARPKRGGGRLGHIVERSKIDEGVSRDYHVEAPGRTPQVLGQFALDQFVVDATRAGLRHHLGRQIDTDQPSRVRSHQRTAQTGAAPGIEHVQAL